MAGRHNYNGTSDLMRAQRFAIQMPIQYRPTGETGWREGRVENVSRSGVLFQAGQIMDVGTPVEMSFELPVEIGGLGGAAVVCHGEIVRIAPAATAEATAALAARILDYRLMRGHKAPDA